ncbi:putative hydrolase of the HAD superfamily [Candidatus Hakubella thermalkaliphila]|uniref:Putative hydrolase of the HAD superfamily n=1 Tax=Candidatus Hakubella thermalkaliphila TaxID=2754717 RepID=A0A6V8PJR3_9ACTN|nr:HAD family hydrolase [Candidatus Hakubella thermalkaliphila]GFP19985.1 putative hydrolase of the HAD superfamily [Candidatus Hakubella thermalkaliphila]GFP23554.1 putative hydrolase of the HAD superfamily [Candidatus Hakubella thermalkaliphila]GFP30572.1 putative hydrolase of the HAD superfamily [Candidatus Hakubella thermalkaliphila]GFP32859.1 putative hydrolase of the HAD superfamily [Candidatus Hakubella thermalkaliphila]GFP39414.1 putative hydrolase of the HAD superfamily [Candidatus Ha
MIKGILFDLGDTIVIEDSVTSLLDPQAKLVPYAKEVISALSGQYRLAVVTNTFVSTKLEVKIALHNLALDQYFDVIVTSVDVGYEKPHEEIFRVALQELGFRPSEVVMVGDRIEKDVVGANRMGIVSILCKWNDRYPEQIKGEMEKPTYSIHSLKELPQILSQMK